MSRMRPIAPDLFEAEADGIRLIGGRRKADGKMVFPLPGGTERHLYEAVLLARRGTLWSWTVQRFRPKTPPYAGPEDELGFKPFCLGYVELPGEIIVETRIEADPVDLRIGIAMEAIAIPFSADSDGTVVATYGFRPTETGQSSGAAA